MIRNDLLDNAASVLTREARAELVEYALEHHPGIPRDLLDSLIQLISNRMAKPPPRPAHGTATAERIKRLQDLIANDPTMTLPRAAQIMGVSLARVNQLVRIAREKGADVPNRAPGRPAQASHDLCMRALPMLVSGKTYDEIREALGIKSLAKMQLVVSTLRARGESVPDQEEVLEWREELDDVAQRGRELYGQYLKAPTAQLKQELAEARALYAAVTQNRPEHVVSAPSL